ncbi:MAG: serine hydrolase domain-containing protein [Bacteroidota bacterium]
MNTTIFCKRKLLIGIGLLFLYLSGHSQDVHKVSSSSDQSPLIHSISGTSIPVKELDAFIQQAMEKVQMPGLSIAIINEGEVVYHRTFGVAHQETQRLLLPTHLLEAASLSKPLFAYFVMKMVDKGVLDLDKPMVEYFPHPGIDSTSQEFATLVTPRMILCHSAGFTNWTQGAPIHIAFEPGTGFSYSGEAYQYLTAVLGMQLGIGWQARLDSVFQAEVAIPLGMEHSYYTWNETIAKQKVMGHDQNGQPTTNTDKVTTFWAAHSLHSEAGDYAKFLLEMMHPQHLPLALRDEMLLEQIAFPPGHELLETGQSGWGLGFARQENEHGMRYLHTGNNHDFQSFCAFYLQQQYGLVFFTNSDKAKAFYDLLGPYLKDEF